MEILVIFDREVCLTSTHHHIQSRHVLTVLRRRRFTSLAPRRKPQPVRTPVTWVWVLSTVKWIRKWDGSNCYYRSGCCLCQSFEYSHLRLVDFTPILFRFHEGMIYSSVVDPDLLLYLHDVRHSLGAKPAIHLRRYRNQDEHGICTLRERNFGWIRRSQGWPVDSDTASFVEFGFFFWVVR